MASLTVPAQYASLRPWLQTSASHPILKPLCYSYARVAEVSSEANFIPSSGHTRVVPRHLRTLRGLARISVSFAGTLHFLLSRLRIGALHLTSRIASSPYLFSTPSRRWRDPALFDEIQWRGASRFAPAKRTASNSGPLSVWSCSQHPGTSFMNDVLCLGLAGFYSVPARHIVPALKPPIPPFADGLRIVFAGR